MNRKQTALTLCAAGAMAALGAIIVVPALAHEGHGKGEVAPYDLDTPRTVSPQTAAHIGLETAEVDFGAVQEVVRLIGVVRPMPDRIQACSARVAGTITQITVQPGDRVRTGDLLVQIDSADLAQRVYEARQLDAQYLDLQAKVARTKWAVEGLRVQAEAAQKRAELSEAEVARLQDNDDVVAANRLGERQAAAVEARATSAQRRVDLSMTEEELRALTRQAEALQSSREALWEMIELSRARQPASAGDDESVGAVRLYAEMDGVVVSRSATVGQGVDAGQTLLEIADYSTVQIQGEVAESLVDRLSGSAGDRVRIRGDSGGPVITEGSVRFLSPIVDPIKRTIHLIVDADNAGGRLRDGMYVEMAVALRAEPEAIVVPASAVVNDGPMYFVFVKDGELYKKQDITPGARDDRVVEVLDGLLPGDVVVSRGAYSLTQLRPKTGAAGQTTEPETLESDKTGDETAGAGETLPDHDH